jgi:uncharacterized protein YeaO (DUF488 family)
MSIHLKRAYNAPATSDGYRVLVDRLWPRGISKEGIKIDLWLKEIAPSDDLRKWFGHDPEKWNEFKKRYFKELDDRPDVVKQLADKVNQGPVTLVFAAKDEEFNNAVAIKEFLQRWNQGSKKS